MSNLIMCEMKDDSLTCHSPQSGLKADLITRIVSHQQALLHIESDNLNEIVDANK